MRKSQFGACIAYLWEGCKPLEDIILVETGKIFEPPVEYKQKIELFRQEELATNPDWYDSSKCRLEGFEEKAAKLHIYLGTTRYSQDKMMQTVKGKPLGWYPNPLAVDVLQETDDGYFCMGLRGGTDFSGIVDVLGAGTVDKDKTVAATVDKECKGETNYSVKQPYDISNARATALIFGEHPQVNTTVGIHLPLNTASQEVDANKEEHSALILVPNSYQIISEILSNGRIIVQKQKLLDEERATAVHGDSVVSNQSLRFAVYDHTLGLLQRYLELRDAGLIKSGYIHKL